VLSSDTIRSKQMSAPAPTDPASASELATIRQLFGRKLVDRATQLAEARWPGSGQMVTLANDWAHLTPAARRERLAAVGPADLARLRGLADLQPDLARVLDDLEKRGVLPPAGELATTTASRDELLVNAIMQGGEAAMHDVAAQAQLRQHGELPTQAPSEQLNAPEPFAQVDWPELDLGLPSTDEMLAQETERRHQAAEAAAATLERVRQRVERSAARALPRTQAPEPAVTPVSDLPDNARVVARPAIASVAPAAATAGQRTLAARIAADVVYAPLDGLTVSSEDVRALGVELGLPVAEFLLEPGALRAVFGGLRMVAGSSEPVAGPLPTALHQGVFAVVRGRLAPKTLARWRAGYCDIPGTRATVRVSPRSRALVLVE
jgi:hypothetical protein